MRRFTLVTVALSSAVAFLVGVILAGGGTGVGSLSVPEAAPPPSTRVHAAAAVGTSVNFADVAERINPAVVNIDAASRAGRERHPRPDDPPDAPRDFDTPHQGSGSGFVIDPQGFILTNYHVVEDADRITVTFADGRTIRADVVGEDPDIDVALLRVHGVSNLPQAPIGNSDGLRRRAVISKAQMTKRAKNSHEAPPCALALSNCLRSALASISGRSTRCGGRYLLVDEIP